MPRATACPDLTALQRLKASGKLELLQEFESWDAASDEDFRTLEQSMAKIDNRVRPDRVRALACLPGNANVCARF